MLSPDLDGRGRSPYPSFHRRNPTGFAGGSGNGCRRQSALPGSSSPPCRCERGIESTPPWAGFRPPCSRSHLSAPARRGGLCRLPAGEPAVPPDPALPKCFPLLTFRLTFRLDVSNYYVILTLAILGARSSLAFPMPPCRKRHRPLEHSAAIRDRKGTKSARGTDWQMGLLGITSAMSYVSRKENPMKSLACGVVCFLLATFMAHAQGVGTSGEITGTVTDASGAVLPTATYDVSAELPNFATEIRRGVTVAVGQTVISDFQLKPSQVATVVEVTDQPPVVETERG